MTTFMEVDVRCAVCGELSRVAELTSTSSFGPPDLDLRPVGPARWALQFGVQRCRACGYRARSIGKALPGAAEVVESVVYRGIRESSRLPRVARDYFCRALIAVGTGHPDVGARSFLEAAWVCDDAGAVEQSRICRERSAEMLERAISLGEHEAPREIALAVLADVRRHAEDFDGSLAACEEAARELETSDEEDSRTTAVVTFIRELAESGDTDCHNAAEAFAADEGV